ncbi:prepilin-type cleavage/methylation domain-containing protein [Pandoraea aquatica]|uniref:Prepilin-type cleavage/methylation domain-containing protein n=1 Tax=Pandoraea aquatica TaxID=2508290 RepID=A0A5E4TCV4_9BURK|nr:prepilin-type N-terminal cleavage/methylation domain-containing protein [Pandoraea aquatica]VVD85735.1 prepilin-type cleavage/methylation domain-containing protein [Pandoraea aquatica]
MNLFTDANAIAQIKQKLVTRMNKRAQRGVTLVELSVAVAVMGLIMAGAMVGVPRLMNSVKLSQEMKDWQMSVLAVQNAVASGTLIATTAPDKIRDMAIAEPFNRPDGTQTILNRFGGAVTFVPQDGKSYPSSGVKVKSIGYPSAQCEEFASKMNGLFATLSINSQSIKDGKSTSLDKINEYCKKNGSDDVTQAELEFTIAG